MAGFFDNIMDNINKGIATVSTGSKNTLEKTKINSVIKSLENEKNQFFVMIGNKVYEHYLADSKGSVSLSEVASYCDEIKARIDKIEEQKIKIQMLDEEIQQAMSDSGFRMSAPVNNNVVPNPTPQETAEPKITCACGYENSADAKFCANCGNKL